MGGAALLVALASLASLMWPQHGMYLALGLAITALGLGWTGYARREDRSPMRLCAAGAVTLGAIGALLASAKIALTFLALGAIEQAL